MPGVRKPNRKGFPPNLYQDRNGYFSYRNPDNGKRRGVGKDKAAAFREARAANAVLANMTVSTLSDWVSGVEQLSLTEWLPKYEAKWIADRDAPLAENSLRTGRQLIARIGRADFAWRALTDITAQHISAFLTEIAEQGGKSTTVSMRTRLMDVFKLAEVSGLIEAGKNPVIVTEARKVKVKRERMSLEQFLAIRDHAETPATTRNAMNLALVTGQRREEIAEMKFADVMGGYLHVVQGKSQGQTKLQLDVSIRLGVVGLSIDDVVKQCRDRVVSAFMVHRVKSHARYKAGTPISIDQMSGDFSDARDRAGVSAVGAGRTPPTFHEIRSLSQRLYRAEFGADFAQALLGHKNARTTELYDDLRAPVWRIVAVK